MEVKSKLAFANYCSSVHWQWTEELKWKHFGSDFPLFSCSVNTADGGLLINHIWPSRSGDDVDAGAGVDDKSDDDVQCTYHKRGGGLHWSEANDKSDDGARTTERVGAALKWSEPNQV